MATERFLFAVTAAVALIFSMDVTSYNPSLTYIPRFKKITLHPNISGECIIDQYKEKQFVNGNISINMNETIDSVVAVFQRCNSEGFDCEYFQTWKMVDICPKLKDKNQLWSAWYGAFYPPMVCPINKVHYQLWNATFDIDKAIQWYPDAINYYWKLTQKLYAGSTLVGSYTMEVSAFGYRKKNKALISKILPI